MIPFRKRGMYQALQNGMFGFGAICGASFGGSIADSIGWRWCFNLQVPISIFALFVGALVIKNPEGGFHLGQSFKDIWSRVDFTGAMLLVIAISVQLVGLSLGGNELPWTSPWVIGSLVGSFVLLALFLVVEARTRAIPVIPLRLLHGKLPALTQFSNICVGMSAYAVSIQLSPGFLSFSFYFLISFSFFHFFLQRKDFSHLCSTCSTSHCFFRSCCSTPPQLRAAALQFHPWQHQSVVSLLVL